MEPSLPADEDRPRPRNVMWLVAAVIVLAGVGLRAAHLPAVGFDQPYRWGALFAEFADQIADHGYRLPERIPFYSEGGTPFAYPPLPFYMLAAFTRALSVPEFVALNLLPAIFACLTLPAFLWLAAEASLDRTARRAALAVYALMPNAFTELVEAGGIAEAFGSTALLCCMACLVRAHRGGSLGTHVAAAALWAACVCSSPGSAYASILAFLVFAAAQAFGALRARKVRPLILVVGVGLLAMLLSAPYWLTVAVRHGMGVFFGTLADQHEAAGPYSLISLLTFRFSGGPFALVLDAAVLLGVVLAAARKRWGLLAVLVLFQSVPREGMWLAPMPAAILAGMAWGDVLLPWLGRLREQSREPAARRGFAAVTSLLVVLALANACVMIRNAVQEPDAIAPPAALEAMQWLRDNSEEDARVVVLSQSAVVEWTAHAAKRTVLNMRFGAEWDADERERVPALSRALAEANGPQAIRDAVRKGFGDYRCYVLGDFDRVCAIASAPAGPDASCEMLWDNGKVAVARIAVVEGESAQESVPGSD